MATKVKTGVIDSSAITSALIANASITADDLHATLDLSGKTVTVATASAGDNDTSVASTAFVSTAIANLADSAPSTLNTLNELAAALGDDANYATTTTNAIATKLPLAGGAMTGAITTNSTFDGVDIATRDGVLTSTTTTANAALPKAGGTLTGDLILGDTVKVEIGSASGGDLQLYHSGGNSFIKSTTGWLNMPIGGNGVSIANSNFSEQLAVFNLNGAIELYHDNSKKFETEAGGVHITGYADADNFKIAGAQGSDGQVLTSTGSGVAWEAAVSSFASLTDTTVTNADPTITTNPSSGVGTIWVNSTSGETYVCTNATTNYNVWKNVGGGSGDIALSSTGGTKVTTGGYVYHTFTSSGNFVFAGSKSAQALIIAGGGGGGGQAANGGGGGGAGGLVYASSINLTSQTYAVTVGAGGVAGGTSGGNGGNSSFQGETVAVGGGGGGAYGSPGNSGGSGGGGGRDSNTSSGGAATSGQGNAGGASIASCGSAGGGGGAGQAGIAGAYDCNNMNATQGDGGDGVNTYSAWATATSTGVGGYYAGGGAGAVEAQTHLYGRNEGGLGGGGIGAMGYSDHGTSATANTGSGGGGGQTFQSTQRNAGAGGSGIVIVRYAV